MRPVTCKKISEHRYRINDVVVVRIPPKFLPPGVKETATFETENGVFLGYTLAQAKEEIATNSRFRKLGTAKSDKTVMVPMPLHLIEEAEREVVRRVPDELSVGEVLTEWAEAGRKVRRT